MTRLFGRIRASAVITAACAALLVPAFAGQATAAARPDLPADTSNCQPQGTVSLAGGEYTLQNNEWNSSAPSSA